MNHLLRLPDQLLARARQFVDLGLSADARNTLTRLLRQSGASSAQIADAHALLGDLAIDAGHYRRARRHFVAVIHLRPDCSSGYARYAAAVEADPEASPGKGVAALRRAIRIDAHEPSHWTALGRLALRAGDSVTAFRAFRRAARLCHHSLPVLGEVLDGLLRLGREREARRVLVAARFAAPKDARIVVLWNRFRFDCLRRQLTRDGRGAAAGDPVILPFTGSEESLMANDVSPTVIRADRRSRSSPHVLRLSSRPADPRRAQ